MHTFNSRVMYFIVFNFVIILGVVYGNNSLTRSDGKCGVSNPLPNGNPAQCDPNGPGYCCSKWGHCGNTPSHCDCPECINYKSTSSIGKKGHKMNMGNAIFLGGRADKSRYFI